MTARDSRITPSPRLTPDQLRRFRRPLLKWYRAHRRDLPWRSDTPKPYHVFVSEAMLQQTQVATVVDYFRRFVARFPTVEALAEATEAEVLWLWQGLGYYRRARSLHAAARAIVADHAGRVPDAAEALRRLPGVGRYTAGAVASIAYGRREAILDGNVARVLARVFGLRAPIDLPSTTAQLWDLAGQLVPKDRPGDFNQAMMELGALVCTPRAPRCLTCPMAKACEANRLGLADALPARLPRRPPRAVEHHALAVERDGRYLLIRRPARGLWAGMWGLPTAEDLAPPTEPAQLVGWLAEHGLRVGPLQRAGAFIRQTTHRTIEVVVWRTAHANGDWAGESVWRRPQDTADLTLARPQERAWALAVVAGSG